MIRDADGRPDAVKYDRLALYLLAVVQGQQRRIAELERAAAQAPVLEARLQKIEALFAQRLSNDTETARP